MAQVCKSAVGIDLAAALAVRILQLEKLGMPVMLPQREDVRPGGTLVGVAARAACEQVHSGMHPFRRFADDGLLHIHDGVCRRGQQRKCCKEKRYLQKILQ